MVDFENVNETITHVQHLEHFIASWTPPVLKTRTRVIELISLYIDYQKKKAPPKLLAQSSALINDWYARSSHWLEFLKLNYRTTFSNIARSKKTYLKTFRNCPNRRFYLRSEMNSALPRCAYFQPAWEEVGFFTRVLRGCCSQNLVKLGSVQFSCAINSFKKNEHASNFST